MCCLSTALLVREKIALGISYNLRGKFRCLNPEVPSFLFYHLLKKHINRLAPELLFF